MLYTSPRFEETGNAFFQQYTLIKIVDCAKPSAPIVATEQQRCRFCRLLSPAVSFEKRAHLIPELMGNKLQFLGDECDACNVHFGGFERHLAAFLGMGRTIQHTDTKRNTPIFTSGCKRIVAEEIEVPGGAKAIEIKRNESAEAAFDYDPEKGTQRIRYKKAKHIPILAYKAFLKMALSCMPAEHLSNYGNALRYLLTSEIVLSGMTKLITYSRSITASGSAPVVFLFEKLRAEDEVPTHIFYLYFQNFIFQTVIPLHSSDLRFYNKARVSFTACPPLYSSAPTSEPFIQVRVDDLSSSEPQRPEEVLSLQFSPQYLNNLVAIDPKTGQTTATTFNIGDYNRIIVSDTPFRL